MDILQKSCSICKVTKSLKEFHNLKAGKHGKHSNCKECRENYRKKLSYNKPKNGKIKCCKCHIIKEVSEFYRDRSSSTGLQSYCKCCQKEKIYESQSKLEGYIIKLINQQKDFKLQKEDVLKVYYKQNKKCALSDELLTYYSGNHLTKDKYESRYNIAFSKIDLSKEYSLDNLQLLGKEIYRMKGNLSNKEFIRNCKLIVNLQK